MGKGTFVPFSICIHRQGSDMNLRGRYGRLVRFASFVACLLVVSFGLRDAHSAVCSGGTQFSSIQAAYAGCQAAGDAYVAGITPAMGDNAYYTCDATQCDNFSVALLLHAGYNNHGAAVHTQNGPYLADQARCPAGGSGYTNANGNVVTKAGFLGDSAPFCDMGCDSTFTHVCEDATKACVGVGAPGSWYANPGYITYTGNTCTPNIGAGNPPPGKVDKSDPQPECQGDVCLSDDDKNWCKSDTGTCTPTDHPDCGVGSDDALCGGNPPPTPPNPPITPNTPVDHKDWVVNDYSNNGGPVKEKTDAYGNPPPDDTGCQSGQKKVGNDCVSVCPANQHWNGTGCDMTCPPGQSIQGGQCSSLCPPGQSLSGTSCVSTCPSGTVRNANGVCTSGDPGSIGTCPEFNAVIDGDGNCKGTCTVGSLNVTTDVCVSTCPSGTVPVNGICQANNCASKPGTVALNGQCVLECPPGMTAQNGACVQGNSDSGGIDCGAAPVCSGDQILCNIDYQDWKARCPSLPPGPDPQTYLDSQPTNGSTAFTDGPTTPTFDNSGFLSGSGACVQFDPINVSVLSQSVTLDIANSSWCLVSQLLGALVLLMAYFKAAQIVLRGG